MLLIAILVSLTVVVLAVFGFYLFRKSYLDYKKTFHTTINSGLVEMFLFFPPETLFVLTIILILVVFFAALLLTGALILSIIIALSFILIPRIMLHILKKRRLKLLTQQLPDFLMSVSRAMQAGSSLNQSLEVAITEDSGPVSQEFALVMKEVRLGVDFSKALDNFSRRVPIEEAMLVATAIKISREIGGNLSEAIFRLSNTLRSKLEMEGKIQALTGQGRMQGIVMTLLPIFLGFVLFKMEPEAMEKLFTDPIGWVVLALIVIMELIGYFFIRKIVNIDV
ncbi:type II secretion system F family protein [Candidatus Gracilibacteria bacterium]|nr:type II secretion system F family protein [Candidatus Gracilibacteria bacterium]